ncbi:MAG: alanine racemase [Calditerrivibrio sp.]|nr:alanine racemase [Calditerrivibrio sp.]
MKNIRGTYALIDLERYLNNVKISQRLSNSFITPVIKADGYGHGAIELAKYILNNTNIDTFCVATVEEGIKLRDGIGNKANIIILGYTHESYFNEVLDKDLLLNIYDDVVANKFNNYLKKINIKRKISIKIDTGMNRIGYPLDFSIQEFLSNYTNLEPSVIMSHLSSPDSDKEYTQFQIDNFLKVVVRTRSIIPDIKTSLFNSPALTYLENRFDYSRPGIITYGYVKSDNFLELKPVMSIFSKIIHTKILDKNESVGYNRAHKTNRKTKVGVLPIGYADGYNRLLSNRGSVFIGGFKCNVIGRICMDMTMIDITDLPESFLDREVEILGDHIRADELASLCSTIPYEILTRISSRIPRVYKGKDG